MARHGCRNHRLLTIFCFAIALSFSSFQAALVRAAETDTQAVGSEDAIDLRLELTWKSETPRQWAGDIFVVTSNEMRPEPNRLSAPGNLTPGMLLSGGIQLSQKNDLIRFSPPPSIDQCRDRSGRFVPVRSLQGGLSFRVSGKESERLVFAFRREDSNETTTPIAITLEELKSGKPIESKFNDKASWTVRRQEDDRLRVTITPTQPDAVVPGQAGPEMAATGTSLFWDDQESTIAIQSGIVDAAATAPLELTCETVDFTTHSQAGALQSWPVSLTNGRPIIAAPKWQPPKGDGCYELRWKLRRKVASHSLMGVPISGSLTESITHPMSMLRGTNQGNVMAESLTTIVVLSRQPRTSSAANINAAFKLVGRIEPLSRSWSVNNYLPLREATRLVSQGNSGSSPQLSKATIGGKQVAELAPGGFSVHGLPIAKHGARHRIRVHLPNGQAMKLGICVLDEPSLGGKPAIVRDLTCIRTRQKTNDSQWVTAEVDFYPQSNNSQLMLINRDKSLSASFEAIDVSVLEEAKPANDEKPLEVQGPRPAARTALMHLDTTQWLAAYGDLLPAQRGGSVKSGNAFVAAVRLAEAVRRDGYSGVMLTVCEDGQTLFPTSSMTPDISNRGSLPISTDGKPEALELLMRLFDRESLMLLPCVRPNFPITALEQAIAEGTPASRGIAVLTPWKGLSLDLSLNEVESACGGVYNPTNEIVAAQITSLVNELSTVCSGHSCVDTIGVMADEGSSLCLPQARMSMDSGALDRFHASLPPNTTARSQLVAWINNEGATAFDQWRQDRLRSLYAQLLLSTTAKDKNLLVATTMEQPSAGVFAASQDSRMVFSRLYRRSQLEPLAARCRDEHTTGSTSLSSASIQNLSDSNGDIFSPTAIFITPVSSIEPTLGDIEMLQRCGLASSPIATIAIGDPESSSLSVAKLLGRSDRTRLAISGIASSGDNEVRRRSLARFQNLPPTLMNDVPPADEAMKFAKLRQQVYEGATYFVATNHSSWPILVTASIKDGASLQSVLPTDGLPKITVDGTWSLSLQPGELFAVRAAVPNAKIQAWSAQIEGGESRTAEIGNMLRELADLLAATMEPRSASLIENPGFEADRRVKTGAAETPSSQQTGQSTATPINVVGWMVAQHPVGATGIDEDVAFEGKQSIRLSNRDGRPGGTWIVSRPIDAPSSGRIAVSLMIRGEPSEDTANSNPITVRFAIEGNVAGSSFRQSKSISVPRNGQWSSTPCRIEIDSVPRCGVESLRIAVDVMNEGTVWVDDIKSEDSFTTAAEKSQLQSQVFLAIGGITKGELSPAVKLLDSHWIQQILGSPIEPQRPTLASRESLERARTKGDKVFTEPPRPGMAERLKGWLPRSIRF